MRIALTGNPNSGKTTMYNALTGRNEKACELHSTPWLPLRGAVGLKAD